MVKSVVYIKMSVQNSFFCYNVKRGDNVKTVLIATTNNDKYTTVKNIFENTIFPNTLYKIESLKTLNIELENKKEEGDNLTRARNKALFAFEQLREYNFDYIVGLDDAIVIKNRVEPNVKEYINKILFENYLNENEEFAFIRAYVIIDKDNNIYETTATIPYLFRENKNAIVKENSYPLSYVSCPIGYEKPVNELTDEERLKYYLKYIDKSIKKLNLNK